MTTNTMMVLLGSAATLTAQTASALQVTVVATAGRVPAAVVYRVSITTRSNLPREYPVEFASDAVMDAVQSGGDTAGAIVPGGPNDAANVGRVIHAGTADGATTGSVTFSPFSAQWLAVDLRKDIAAALHVDPSVLGVQDVNVMLTTNWKIPQASNHNAFNLLQQAPNAEAWLDLETDFEVSVPESIGGFEAQTITEITKSHYATSNEHLSAALRTVTVEYEKNTLGMAFPEIVYGECVVFCASLLAVLLMCAIAVCHVMKEVEVIQSLAGEEDHDESEVCGLVVLAGTAEDVAVNVVTPQC